MSNATDSKQKPASRHLVSNLIFLTIIFLAAAFLIFGWLIFSSDVLSNDYPVYQLRYAQTYRYYLSKGIELMWYPHIELGMPAGGLVMAQAFHLPAWLISMLPMYWSGSALKIFSAKHIILCALTQSTYFFGFIRFVKLSYLASFILSFLLTYQLRTLDNIRYGTFNDAFTYFLLALISGIYFLQTGKKISLIVLIIATQFTMSCGYQPILTYGILTSILISPIIIRFFLSNTDWLRRLPITFITAVFGVLLAAPHWLPFIDFLNSNAKRVGETTIEWADQYSLITNNPFPQNLLGYLTNLAFPWHSEIHSAFGSSSLYSLVLLTILTYFLLTIRKNLLYLAIFLTLFIYIGGTNGGLYTILYNYFPTIKLSRVPGRMSVGIAVICFAVICLIITQIRDNIKYKLSAIFAMKIASISFIALITSSFILLKDTPALVQGFTPFSLNTSNWNNSIQFVWIISAAVTAILFYFISPQIIDKLAGAKYNSPTDALLFWTFPTFLSLITLIFIISTAQTYYLMRYGSWTRVRGGDPTYKDFEIADNLPIYANYPFIAASVYGIGYETATKPALNFYRHANPHNISSCFYPIRNENELVKNTYLPFYLTNEIICRKSWSEAFKQIDATKCLPEAAVLALENSLACSIRTDPKRRGLPVLIRLNETTKISELTPHSITLITNTKIGALLVTPFPLIQGWTVNLDGKTREALEVNGGLLAVAVPPGDHTIRIFYYSNKKEFGYLLAFLATALIITYALQNIYFTRFKNKNFQKITILLALYLITLTNSYCGYLFWQKRYKSRIDNRITLNNSYDYLLKLQLAKWEKMLAEAKLETINDNTKSSE